MAITPGGASNKFFITVVQTISETSELYYFNGSEQVSVSITPDDIEALSTNNRTYQLKSSNISIERNDIRGIVFGKQFLNVRKIDHSYFLANLFRESKIEEIDHLDLSGLQNLTEVGDYAFAYMFHYCNVRTLPYNFTLPENLKIIGQGFGLFTFYGCRKLESLPDIFNLPQNINKVIMNEKVEYPSILDYMFGSSGLKKLPNNFNLPQKIRNVEYGYSDDDPTTPNFAFAYCFFEYCESLETISNCFALPSYFGNYNIGNGDINSCFFAGCENLLPGETDADIFIIPTEYPDDRSELVYGEFFNGTSSEFLDAQAHITPRPTDGAAHPGEV
jgi:hypothetical protein